VAELVGARVHVEEDATAIFAVLHDVIDVHRGRARPGCRGAARIRHRTAEPRPP
jgi:hypothetical protein